MDYNAISIMRSMDSEEEDAELACREEAARHGLTNLQADGCDDGSYGCTACPFAPVAIPVVTKGQPAPIYAGGHLVHQSTD